MNTLPVESNRFESDEEDKKEIFPKRIGILFIEELNKDKSKLVLNFDQLACAHLLLQMNTIQKIFDLQIIVNHRGLPYFHVPAKDHQDLFRWFDEQIRRFESRETEDVDEIDYWIGVTSEKLGGNLFFDTREETGTGKPLAIITSFLWERAFSPPSLFEYLALNIFQICLGFLDSEFEANLLGAHDISITKGCIFDYDQHKPHIRLTVSNPNLCSDCKEAVTGLEEVITDKTKMHLPLLRYVNKVLSKVWLLQDLA